MKDKKKKKKEIPLVIRYFLGSSIIFHLTACFPREAYSTKLWLLRAGIPIRSGTSRRGRPRRDGATRCDRARRARRQRRVRGWPKRLTRILPGLLQELPSRAMLLLVASQVRGQQRPRRPGEEPTPTRAEIDTCIGESSSIGYFNNGTFWVWNRTQKWGIDRLVIILDSKQLITAPIAIRLVYNKQE